MYNINNFVFYLVWCIYQCLPRIFFCRWGGLNFSLPIQLAHANVGLTTTSVEFARNTIADPPMVQLLSDIEQDMTSSIVQKIMLDSVGRKTTILAPRFSVRFVQGWPRPVIFLDWCRLEFFSIQVCHEFFCLPHRSVIFFYAYSISTDQYRPKHNVGWIHTKYHRRPRW